MIKSSKGKLRLKGTGVELMADFAIIAAKMGELFPKDLVAKCLEEAKVVTKTKKEKITDGK